MWSGRGKTRGGDEKLIFNFIWPYYDFYLEALEIKKTFGHSIKFINDSACANNSIMGGH